VRHARPEPAAGHGGASDGLVPGAQRVVPADEPADRAAPVEEREDHG